MIALSVDFGVCPWQLGERECHLYRVCGNPLHRLHRILLPTGNTFQDVIEDGCEMVDDMLDLLARLYAIDPPCVTRSIPIE
jgi:hypothetical protein